MGDPTNPLLLTFLNCQPLHLPHPSAEYHTPNAIRPIPPATCQVSHHVWTGDHALDMDLMSPYPRLRCARLAVVSQAARLAVAG